MAMINRVGRVLMRGAAAVRNGPPDANGNRNTAVCLNATREKRFEDSEGVGVGGGAKVGARIHPGEDEPSHWKTNNAEA